MQRNITLILGQTGSGKTHLARNLIKGSPRVFILDSGFSEFDAESIDGVDSLLALCIDRNYFSDGSFRLAITPFPAEYDAVFQIANELGDLALVIEEADRFDFGSLPSYQESVLRGRHSGVRIIALSTRAHKLPKDLRGQITELYSFRQTEPSDIDYLVDIVGEKGNEIPALKGPPSPPPNPYLRWDSLNGAKIIGPQAPPRPEPEALPPEPRLPEESSPQNEIRGGS